MSFFASFLALFLQVPALLNVRPPHAGAPVYETIIEPSANCRSCDFIVPEGRAQVDIGKMNLKPGSVICLSSEIRYGQLTLSNIQGTPSNPIIIRNCGGPVLLTAPDKPFVLKIANSKHFRLTGGRFKDEYGIKLTGARGNGLVLGPFTTDFEVDHIEVYEVGFAGIMGKTEPGCDEATHRGNFTMRNINLHNNFIHDTAGEGFYIGHTAYAGAKTACGEALPHTIENIRIHHNLVRNSGWDAIQLSCATFGASIDHNTVENYSVAKRRNQSGGITIGTGTTGVCHSNIINSGHGPALVVFGSAENYIYNNIILNPGGPGVFCDERSEIGKGYFFLNNTIINPKLEGFKLYCEKAPVTVVVNNIIVNTGKVDRKGKRTPITSYKKVNLDSSANYYASELAELGFVDAGQMNFRPSASSPVVNKGRDIAGYFSDGMSVPNDFYGASRKEEGDYDIGAAEYQPVGFMHWLRKLFSSTQ